MKKSRLAALWRVPALAFVAALSACGGGGGSGVSEGGATSNPDAGVVASTPNPSPSIEEPTVIQSEGTYTVGGTIAGLISNGLVLKNGADTIELPAQAVSFVLPTALPNLSSYGVQVQSQPEGLTCSVANGSGTVASAKVTDVAISCSAQGFSLGGTVTALKQDGLVLANGSDVLNVMSGDTSFTMPGAVSWGSAYAVTVQSQPMWARCTADNGSGTARSAVSNVAVGCSPWAQVTTVAGNGTQGTEDGTGSAAHFRSPYGIAKNSAGDFFIVDYNSAVRKMSADGVVTTFISIPNLRAIGIAVDAADNIYVGDNVNHVVHKITPAGVVTTLAGSGNDASADGIGTAASFRLIYGLAIDSQANVYATEYQTKKIRKITPDGEVSTLPSIGSSDIGGLAIDADDNIYIAGGAANQIFKVTKAGVISTVAGTGGQGSDDGPGLQASFYTPIGVAVAADGNIYVADSFNSRIRRIDRGGNVTTIAGTSYGFVDGSMADAKITRPFGLTVDSHGALYVPDTFNNAIRKLTP